MKAPMASRFKAEHECPTSGRQNLWRSSCSCTARVRRIAAFVHAGLTPITHSTRNRFNSAQVRSIETQFSAHRMTGRPPRGTAVHRVVRAGDEHPLSQVGVITELHELERRMRDPRTRTKHRARRPIELDHSVGTKNES